jgi:hypothetical protein
MGIAPYVAEAIIREHKYRPIRGDVLLLGRQTMEFSPEHAADMIRAAGLAPAVLPHEDDIVDRRTWKAKGQKFIRDSAFFRLLGVSSVRALDHTNYEGAEIIHDLNKPVSADMEQAADFIVDGSTLDNLFSPSIAIQSVARMLRPQGRFLSATMGSFHTDEYTIVNPYWFLDYFTVNRFADCRVYVTTHGDRGQLNVYAVDPAARRDRAFRPLDPTGLLVFAEKAANSSWNEIPSQRYYADPEDIEARVQTGRRFLTSDRPELLVSIRPKPFRRLRTLKYFLAAENRTVDDFNLIIGGGHRIKIPVSPLLILARAVRRFTVRQS